MLPTTALHVEGCVWLGDEAVKTPNLSMTFASRWEILAGFKTARSTARSTNLVKDLSIDRVQSRIPRSDIHNQLTPCPAYLACDYPIFTADP